MSIGILPRMPEPEAYLEPEKMHAEPPKNAIFTRFSPLIMAISVFCACSLTGCGANTPHTLTPEPSTTTTPSTTSATTRAGGEDPLPAAIESPSTATLTGRLIDLDPAVRWACSYSGIAVEAVEKPSDSARVYRMTDSRQTPMRIEITCKNFTRGHFTEQTFDATAAFGRIPDTPRQNRLLRKIQQRLDQLATRTR